MWKPNHMLNQFRNDVQHFKNDVTNKRKSQMFNQFNSQFNNLKHTGAEWTQNSKKMTSNMINNFKQSSNDVQKRLATGVSKLDVIGVKDTISKLGGKKSKLSHEQQITEIFQLLRTNAIDMRNEFQKLIREDITPISFLIEIHNRNESINLDVIKRMQTTLEFKMKREMLTEEQKKEKTVYTRAEMYRLVVDRLKLPEYFQKIHEIRYPQILAYQQIIEDSVNKKRRGSGGNNSEAKSHSLTINIQKHSSFSKEPLTPSTSFSVYGNKNNEFSKSASGKTSSTNLVTNNYYVESDILHVLLILEHLKKLKANDVVNLKLNLREIQDLADHLLTLNEDNYGATNKSYNNLLWLKYLHKYGLLTDLKILQNKPLAIINLFRLSSDSLKNDKLPGIVEFSSGVFQVNSFCDDLFTQRKSEHLELEELTGLRHRREIVKLGMQQVVHDEYDQLIRAATLIDQYRSVDAVKIRAELKTMVKNTNTMLEHSHSLIKSVQQQTNTPTDRNKSEWDLNLKNDLEKEKELEADDEFEEIKLDFLNALGSRHFEEVANVIHLARRHNRRNQNKYFDELKRWRKMVRKLVLPELNHQFIVKRRAHFLYGILEIVLGTATTRKIYLDNRTERLRLHQRTLVHGDSLSRSEHGIVRSTSQHVKLLSNLTFKYIHQTSEEFLTLFTSESDASSFTQWVLHLLSEHIHSLDAELNLFKGCSWSETCQGLSYVFQACDTLLGHGMDLSFHVEQLSKKYIVTAMDSFRETVDAEIQRALSTENWEGEKFSLTELYPKDAKPSFNYTPTVVSKSAKLLIKFIFSFCDHLKLLQVELIHTYFVSTICELIEGYILSMFNLTLQSNLVMKKSLTLISNAMTIHNYLKATIIPEFELVFCQPLPKLNRLLHQLQIPQKLALQQFVDERSTFILKELCWDEDTYNHRGVSRSADGHHVPTQELLKMYSFLIHLSELIMQVLSNEDMLRAIIDRVMQQVTKDLLSNESPFYAHLTISAEEPEMQLSKEELEQILFDFFFIQHIATELRINNNMNTDFEAKANEIRDLASTFLKEPLASQEDFAGSLAKVLQDSTVTALIASLQELLPLPSEQPVSDISDSGSDMSAGQHSMEETFDSSSEDDDSEPDSW